MLCLMYSVHLCEKFDVIMHAYIIIYKGLTQSPLHEVWWY